MTCDILRLSVTVHLALSVFPAYLKCLLDPDWPIPGLSKWGSRAVIGPADLTNGHQHKIDTNSIEHTTWEDRTLLFTVQELDHWLRVEDGGTLWVYRPCLLLVG